jgi:hypothetical protein
MPPLRRADVHILTIAPFEVPLRDEILTTPI